MADTIKVELSTNNDVIYDSIEIVNKLLQESNTYPSSQKRVLMSDFLFGLKIGNKQIGFISAAKDEKFYDDILVLDYCLLKPYRENKQTNLLLNEIVKYIISSPLYHNEFIAVDLRRSHDKMIMGYPYDDNIVLLQNRLEELSKVHPDGIVKNRRVYQSRQLFNKNEKRSEK